MKIVVVGPGALGCLFTAALAESGQQVLLLDHRPHRADFINRRGITVEDGGVERRVHAAVTASPEEASGADLVLICVKAYQTEAAIAPLAPHLGPKSRVLTLQNGLGNVEALARVLGPERVWGGVTAQGATELGLGQIRHGGKGDTMFGALAGDAEAGRLQEACDAFNSAGLPTRIEPGVESLIWSKLIVNVGINPLTALTRLRNGQLLEYSGTNKLMEDLVAEAVAVAEAVGVTLLYPDPLARVREVARVTAANVASMLQDVMAKRRTEIGHINGAIEAKGRELGIPTPANAAVAALIETIEASYGQGV